MFGVGRGPGCEILKTIFGYKVAVGGGQVKVSLNRLFGQQTNSKKIHNKVLK